MYIFNKVENNIETEIFLINSHPCAEMNTGIGGLNIIKKKRLIKVSYIKALHIKALHIN